MPSAPTKVVFLIDEQCLMRPEGISLEQLKLSIVRVLLFYYAQPDQQNILWGYRFFSTKTRYAATSIRHFYTMTEDSFDSIRLEYEKRESERQNTASLGTPYMHIKQVLKEAIGDFQWENTDYCTTTNTSKHYVYVLTECPTTLKDVNRFFLSSNQEEEESTTRLTPSTFPAYIQQTKEELATTLLKSYTQRQISISLIDTNFKVQLNNPEEKLVDQMISQGFQNCFYQFNGNYIEFTKLVRNYHVYGHSFVSEFTNVLPNQYINKTQLQQPQVPAWKGPFKTKLGKSIGNFDIFPSRRNGFYQASTFAFISQLRAHTILHASQFSLSWLIEDTRVDPNHDYRITLSHGESSESFQRILDKLYSTQSVLIAELIPMAGYEESSKKVCIEPFSRSSASLRILNIQNLPNTVQLSDVVVDADYPIGTFIAGTMLQVDLPPEQDVDDIIPHTEINLDTPHFIKKLTMARNTDRMKEKIHVNNTQQKVEYDEKIIQLPANVNMMGKALKELYLELLYTQNDTVENNLIIIDEWIKHLLKNNYTKQEIISTLFDHTMTLEDLDVKHRNNTSQTYKTNSNSLEQTYLAEWWNYVKNKGSTNANFEKMSCIILKLKEARIQVILYCFIARLMTNSSESTIKRDPFELAENFFKKTVLPFALHDITDFLTELDSEEGSLAVARRDPADLNDYVFMQLLEKCFTDLPNLTNKFKENVGMDDMTSATASPPSVYDDFNDDDVSEPDPSQLSHSTPSSQQPQTQIQSLSKVKPKERYDFKESQLRRAQSDRTLSKHSQTDTIRLSKPDHRKSKPYSLVSLSKKPLLPIPIQRTNSNSKLDGLHKRMIHVPSNPTKAADIKRGEAAQEAIAKVNRSTVNGRPTMKRTGSFTRSAQSPKRVKRHASMLSSDTNSVVLRRDNIPDPQTTPRTSLNRHLGTNLFAEYSETCLSPSRTIDDEFRQSPEYLQSEYPQGSITPTGTANRYKKIMNITPNRDEDEIDLDDKEFSVLESDEFEMIQQQYPPYTPRTAARRAKDRIDRSQISVHPGRNLTSKFQNIFDEEKQERPPLFKRNSNYLFEGEDDENVDPFSDNDSSSSRPLLSRNTSFNENNRKIGSLSFVEDSDSESDNESNITTNLSFF